MNEEGENEWSESFFENMKLETERLHIKAQYSQQQSVPDFYALTLKSLIVEQTGINEQDWKKVPPCLLIY